MELVRANSLLFDALEESWRGQCESYSENFEDYASPQRSHAREIVSENPPDTRYGIWLLRRDENNFDALMHINRARLPDSHGYTLRVLWILLAPEFDFTDINSNRISSLCSTLINQCIHISDAEYKADHIKIHIGNTFDREFFKIIGEFIQGNPYYSDARVRGNWFHLSKRKQGENT